MFSHSFVSFFSDIMCCLSNPTIGSLVYDGDADDGANMAIPAGGIAERSILRVIQELSGISGKFPITGLHRPKGLATSSTSHLLVA